jgi:hypothetical protein
MPDKWKVSQRANEGDKLLLLDVTSPDFKPEGGYGDSKLGAQILIDIYPLTNEDYIPTSQEILNSKRGKEILTEISAVTIDVFAGVTYKASYEGPARLAYQFEHDNKKYLINIDEDIDGPVFNTHLDTYKKVVDSFKVL